MTTFQGKDDVLTLLVHLGYLSYHWMNKTVSIPNKEVSQEYINAISTMNWKEVIDSVEASKKFLRQCDMRDNRLFDGMTPQYKPEVIVAMEESKKISKDPNTKRYSNFSEAMDWIKL